MISVPLVSASHGGGVDRHQVFPFSPSLRACVCVHVRAVLTPILTLNETATDGQPRSPGAITYTHTLPSGDVTVSEADMCESVGVPDVFAPNGGLMSTLYTQLVQCLNQTGEGLSWLCVCACACARVFVCVRVCARVCVSA